MALPAGIFERTYTLEEFLKVPEFNEGYELIDGRPVKKPMPVGEHGVIADNIRDAITAYATPKKLGRAQREITIDVGTGNNGPIPDVSYWKAERGVKFGRNALPIPDLAVEVFSPSDTLGPSSITSAMSKVRRLLKFGVPIVWVVRPDLKNVEVYHTGQGNKPVRVLNESDELDGETAIPGFKLPVSEIFRDVEG